MIDYLEMVREFHYKYDHHTQNRPVWPPAATIDLRDKLIREEAGEFHSSYTMIQIADAIGDLLYVTFGAALAYGIPIEEVFTEIHRSNMTKSTEKNEFGKSIKGDYSPADIESILDRY